MADPILLHTADIIMRWHDMDAFGHANNAVFLSYFEEVRARWMATISTPSIDWQTQGPVIAAASCTYKKPIIFPETIRTHLYVSAPRRHSFSQSYILCSASAPDIIYATGETTIVWVDRSTGRPVLLPDWLLQHLPLRD